MQARRVIALDSDIEFVNAATRLSKICGIPIEPVLKSAEEIIDLQSDRIDMAFSTSFIEHVYDLPDHFAKVYQSLEFGGLYVAETSLNSYSIRSLLRFRKIHQEAEHTDFSSRTGVLSYLSLRKEMIREAYPQLSNKKVDAIASAARGWAKDDLMRVVEQAVRTGKSQRRFSPLNSNTCNPQTGYWPDRLLSPFETRRYMEAAGFEARILRPHVGWRRIHGIRKVLRIVKGLALKKLPIRILFTLNSPFTVVGKKV